jgi:hypothetical protein
MTSKVTTHVYFVKQKKQNPFVTRGLAIKAWALVVGTAVQ